MDPIQKSITVKASPAHAFQIFTAGIDTWWPREHHIGTSTMKKSIIECRKGGRRYTEQTDGSEAPWGSPRLGPSAAIRPRMADYAPVEIRVRPRKVERSGSVLHTRARRPHARRSPSSLLGTSRRGRGKHARRSGWRWRLGRPPASLRRSNREGRRGEGRCIAPNNVIP